ncbi:3-hydroxyacyl-ACP dehydratase [Planococcus sp. CPCC 101016]|uniref:MaoC/PaaZ C-terminal domain-containing protein n=1 Tax=Planococcus sp. CPCC 101016 TaxID=2599617 RepID=UPI0011B837C2|nr:MaoC/PaaZ C-terminal domain-containing protein [Planococcus sp. CPCC 101016]TWT06773.1 3-hydroxyacyl-ACP dehydratase [Planococcus sp. CPCC 101016]
MKKLAPIIKKPITAIDLVKYSGASGDFNEIHTVSTIAKEKGLDDIIVHGMLVMGWAAAAIETWFPERQLKSFQVRFQAVTFPGTVFVITGMLLAEYEGEIQIKDQQDETKLIGAFTLTGELA